MEAHVSNIFISRLYTINKKSPRVVRYPGFVNRVLMLNFPLPKSLQQRKILQNSDEKQDCQYWIVRLVVVTRFPPNRDCLLKLYVLVKSARTVSR